MDVDHSESVSTRWFGPRDLLVLWVGLMLGGAAGLAAGAMLRLEVAGVLVVGCAGVAAVLSAAVLSRRLGGSRVALDRFMRWSPLVAALALAAPFGWPAAWAPVLVLAAAALVIIGLGLTELKVAAHLLGGAAFVGLAVVYGCVWAVRGWDGALNAVFAVLALVFAGLGVVVLLLRVSLAGTAFMALGVLMAAGGVLAGAGAQAQGADVRASGPVGPAVLVLIGAGFVYGGLRTAAEERVLPAGSPFDDVGAGEVLFLSVMVAGVDVWQAVGDGGDSLATVAIATVSLALAGAGAERLWWL